MGLAKTRRSPCGGRTMIKFDDELCECGHSKGYHKAHALDVHGGECEKCGCKIYTWKKFIKYNDVNVSGEEQ